jgi:hypothetical protein
MTTTDNKDRNRSICQAYEGDQGYIKLKDIAEDSIQIYLLKGTELLLLHLHYALRDAMVPEALTELDPSERVAVLSRVGLPPVESGASQLPCCVQTLSRSSHCATTNWRSIERSQSSAWSGSVA